MKIQIASDLHLEFTRHQFPDYLPLLRTDANVLVLAGDIDLSTQAIDRFANYPIPVVYVHGNHEAYRREYLSLSSDMRAAAAGTQVHYLERDIWVTGAVRFIGCCLWTDYALYGNPMAAMRVAGAMLTDHRIVSFRKERFTPEQALEEHRASLAWLRETLASPFDGPTVVVTHHGVTEKSVHPKYAGDPLAAAFVSELGDLVEQASLWVHGHVHDSFDYTVGTTRVIANPRGYPWNVGAVSRSDELVWENTRYSPALVVEV
jgi:DNA repair exonuclease SbcCD nuclease subunit